MGQVVFVLLVVGGLGYFFYRQMSAGATQSDSSLVQDEKPKSGAGVENNTETPSAGGFAEPDTLEAQIVALVSRTPGILQTEIYTNFPDENRKNLQAILLQMDRDGALRREREGSTYRLFVA
ncbi:MAG: hypothetical protein RBR02_07635 [Desulfuromonadaceae bacterium]|nr:hypothetical protein [Desulfuromonadaceae bacterium]